MPGMALRSGGRRVRHGWESRRPSLRKSLSTIPSRVFYWPTLRRASPEARLVFGVQAAIDGEVACPVEVGAGLFFPDVVAAQADAGQTLGRLGTENAVPPGGPAVDVELDRAALARVGYRGSFADYMIHNRSKWAEEYGIDGYYIDNMVRMTTLTVPVERHNYRLLIIEKK